MIKYLNPLFMICTMLMVKSCSEEQASTSAKPTSGYDIVINNGRVVRALIMKASK